MFGAGHPISREIDGLLKVSCAGLCRCGNVAAILELDEHLNKSFKVWHRQLSSTTLVASTCVTCTMQECGQQSTCESFAQVFEAAPQDVRGIPAKRPTPEYFL